MKRSVSRKKGTKGMNNGTKGMNNGTKGMNNDRETKIEEIVRMLRRMDIRALRRVYFFLLGMI